MDEFYAPANGIRLHCVARGAADAPLMLFVHGFPEFWYCWHAQLDEFGRDYRAVAFDLRGHNLSDKPEGVEAYRIKPLLEDLRQLIEHLRAGQEDKSCVLVAHDWGGAIAWTFAALYPQYVNKLVIINAPHTVPFARALAHDPAQQAASAYMNFFRLDKAERVLGENGFERLLKMFNATASGRCALNDDDIPRYLAAWSQPGALACALKLYRASPLYPPTAGDPGAAALKLDPAALTVHVPTLVIWGEADTALGPVLLEGLDELVPDLRIERFPDGSHWVIHEQPRQLNAAIRAFLAPG
ncbi:alpha/beta hydrolase [Sulfuritalea sp.]|uniref:alpha/beta fold hydrolase n=1 Tax=Sulfuritalea sp. TaxID=2480090 RepID=UPI001ACBAC65|nr:alpha/beta hydrolase [Sulfuritalea sp.]MBN8474330.1 alpha/beta hydrolase [Sulfuritalea sp.]